MARFKILTQGQESGKDEWYAQCLYGEHDTDVTVIISGEVLALFKSMGVSSFPAVVEAALEAAEEVDWNPKQVVVFMESPILQTMMTRVRRQQGKKELPDAP
jgi:vacuolar-type H+-ATPase subunit F/Vma7